VNISAISNIWRRLSWGPTNEKQNNFDLLRLVFSLLVIVSHAPELHDGNRGNEILTSIFHTLSFGEFAVNGFFLLSGFLIFSSWERRPEIGPFLRNRVLRIFPGFIVASITSLFVVGICVGTAGFFPNLNLWAVMKNLILLRQPQAPEILSGSYPPLINGALWTIEYEFRCYLLVALLGMTGLSRRKYVLFAIAAISVLFTVWPPAVFQAYSREIWFVFGNPRELIRFMSFFTVGGIFWQERERIRFHGAVVFLAFVVFILGAFSALFAQAAMAIFGSYVVFYFAKTKCGLLAWIRPKRDISYGIYLYAWPIQGLVFFCLPRITIWQGFVVAVILTIPIAYLSWVLVESPGLKYKASRP